MYSIGTWWMWLSFFIFITIVLTIDIALLNKKKSHDVSLRQAFRWIALWFTCALIFNGLLWQYVLQTHGADIANQKALEFFTGYVIEQSLSIDNMFAFVMIFSYFQVPSQYQRRVLLYGVLSAVFLRLIVVLSGTWLFAKFHWILYLFGIILLISGINMLFPEKRKKNISKNPLLNYLRKHIRLTEKIQSEKFFVKQNKLWYATPLFLVLIAIEISDLIFSVDSVPAVFAVTNDSFIVFTSNIFSILGLRAMYFLLVNLTSYCHLLRYGISLVLVFIGTKMLLAPIISIPTLLSLSIVIFILVTTIILSVLIRPRDK
ncbi:MAG: TerC family protein [Gammaproteobacteria bacterium]|jgi:TerC family integral membrane protein|nr:TerC family protein [Gammaproteobacteria bacterium]